MNTTKTFVARHLKPFANSWMFGAILMAAVLMMAAGAARADERAVREAVQEAVAIHAIATAARLCNLITESDLTRAGNRMDRVHAGQLPREQHESYLILRGSDSFRNMVFASALQRAQAGCVGDLGAVWRDVESSLVMADLNSGHTFAGIGSVR